jgi:predicted RNA-binding Zn-ribbon protein involved in translation (DUF1610 family)
MTVQCTACGQEWPRDPALEVKCPKCSAAIGHYCVGKRPSGHRVRFGSVQIHPDRDQLAMDRGFLQKCAAAPSRTAPAQEELFA